MKNRAFTLAEVLIVLGIIGIISAMTIPVLIKNYQKQLAITGLKKTYTELQHAVDLMRADNDNVEPKDMSFVHQQWDHPSYFDLDLFIPIFTKYLKVLNHKNITGTNSWSISIKMCEASDSTKTYKQIDRNVFGTALIGPVYHAWQLADGRCLGVLRRGDWVWDGYNGGVVFIVDINGSENNPNTLGKDTFLFVFEPNGKIVPLGPTTLKAIEASCSKDMWGRAQGLSCAAKIMNDGWQIKSDYPW